ncbi:Stress response protein nst1 [Malassezia sp. CBS 17886]|nr:Stress response protein nst1 [Malassezia sp. CBS 17886]
MSAQAVDARRTAAADDVSAEMLARSVPLGDVAAGMAKKRKGKHATDAGGGADDAALPAAPPTDVQADLIATASDLYRRFEADPAGDPEDEAYWASLPPHLRTFIRNALPIDTRDGVAPDVDVAPPHARGHAMLAVATHFTQAAAHAAQNGPDGALVDMFRNQLTLQRALVEEAYKPNSDGSFPFPEAMLKYANSAEDDLYQSMMLVKDLEDKAVHAAYPPPPAALHECERAGTESVDAADSPADAADVPWLAPAKDVPAKKKKKSKKKKAPALAPSPAATPTTPAPTSMPPTLPPPVPVPKRAYAPPPSSRAAGKLPMTLHAPPRAPPTAVRSRALEPRAKGGRAGMPRGGGAQRPMFPTQRAGAAPPASGSGLTISSAEERECIQDFWHALTRRERQRLVDAEHESVQQKLREFTRSACACVVCARKRGAIEGKLGELYRTYYDALESDTEQHADAAGGPGPFPGSIALDSHGGVVGANLILARQPHGMRDARYAPLHPRADVEVDVEDDDVYDEDELDEDEYDDEYDDDEPNDDELDAELDLDSESLRHEPLSHGALVPRRRRTFDSDTEHTHGSDCYCINSSLTVKGILAVADDLSGNEVQKLILMMEQLAERPTLAGDACAAPDAPDDERDSAASDAELTPEEQREQGWRMFQIFAARILEHRVLQAYREKVAQERQLQLLRELEEEEFNEKAREAKRAKENQRKKDKKRQLRQQKEEERARSAERERQEEARREEARQEEARRAREIERGRQEEERRKRDAERAAERERQEEERRRRDAQRAVERERQEEEHRKRDAERAAERERQEEERRKRDAERAAERERQEEAHRARQAELERQEDARHARQTELDRAREHRARRDEERRRAREEKKAAVREEKESRRAREEKDDARRTKPAASPGSPTVPLPPPPPFALPHFPAALPRPVAASPGPRSPLAAVASAASPQRSALSPGPLPRMQPAFPASAASAASAASGPPAAPREATASRAESEMWAPERMSPVSNLRVRGDPAALLRGAPGAANAPAAPPAAAPYYADGAGVAPPPLAPPPPIARMHLGATPSAGVAGGANGSLRASPSRSALGPIGPIERPRRATGDGATCAAPRAPDAILGSAALGGDDELVEPPVARRVVQNSAPIPSTFVPPSRPGASFGYATPWNAPGAVTGTYASLGPVGGTPGFSATSASPAERGAVPWSDAASSWDRARFAFEQSSTPQRQDSADALAPTSSPLFVRGMPRPPASGYAFSPTFSNS